MEVVGPPCWYGRFEEGKKLFAPTVVEPQFFQPAQYVTLALEQKVQNLNSQGDDNRLSNGTKVLLKRKFQV